MYRRYASSSGSCCPDGRLRAEPGWLSNRGSVSAAACSSRLPAPFPGDRFVRHVGCGRTSSNAGCTSATTCKVEHPDPEECLSEAQKQLNEPDLLSTGISFGWITRAIAFSGNEFARKRAMAFDKLCSMHESRKTLFVDDEVAYNRAIADNRLDISRCALQPTQEKLPVRSASTAIPTGSANTPASTTAPTLASTTPQSQSKATSQTVTYIEKVGGTSKEVTETTTTTASGRTKVKRTERPVVAASETAVTSANAPNSPANATMQSPVVQDATSRVGPVFLPPHLRKKNKEM